MHYRNGVDNPRNIVKVADDGRETTIAVVYDPNDAVGFVAALNSAIGAALNANACHGCGSIWTVIRSRRAYCTEPTCDRRLPGPQCETCTRPRALHVCLSCSPDELTEGPGCGNCRNTGWDQTPCLPSVVRTSAARLV